MNLRYTDAAVFDLKAIHRFLSVNSPQTLSGFRGRLEEIERHLLSHPDAAPAVDGRPGVRVIFFVKYPYRMFYRIVGDAVDILHIRHVRAGLGSRLILPKERTI
jgi:toxin ParE1/3/4